MSASSARVLPVSPWRARSRGAAGRSWCWRPKASPGTPRGATPALCCRAMRRPASALVDPRRPRTRQEALEAVGAGRRIRPPGRAGRADAGCASQRRRLAACRRRPTTAARCRPKPSCWPESSAPMSNLRSAEQVREDLRSPLYFNGLHYPRGFSIHSLNYALGLAAAAERDGARIYENSAGAGDRSGGRAQARHDPRRARAGGTCRARRQRPSRQPDAAVRQDAPAGVHLCHRHRSARCGAARGDALSRRGERHGSRRQPLLASWRATG